MAEVTTDATNSPDLLDRDEEALYNMSMDELESLALSGKQEVEESVEEDIEQDLEQPDDEEVQTDSVDEDIPEDAEDEVEEEVNETEEPDEETVEDQSDDTEEEAEEEESKEVEDDVYEINAVGTKVKLTMQELKEMASKGIDYTRKLHAVAPWKKQIAAMEEYGINQEDINMLIDLKKGNKDAVLDLVKKNGIDPLDIDLDTVKPYTPKEYSRSDAQIALQETVKRLSVDSEVYSRTERVVDSEWDYKSRQVMLENPTMIEGLHNDIKNGVYEQVQPEMLKIKALDGGVRSDLEYYIEAGKRLQAKEVQAKETELATANKDRERKQADIKEKASVRKAAALPRNRGKSAKQVINYIDEISDDDYQAFMKKVERQY